MAEPTLTEGDTTPPIRGAALDTGGTKLLDLSKAEHLHFLAVPNSGGDVIEGDAEAISSPDPEAEPDDESPLGYNWRYPLAPEDTKPGSADGYVHWVKVTLSETKSFWVTGDRFTIRRAPE